MAPKVVEALLGTRFQGRDFVKAPLVRLLGLSGFFQEGMLLLWGASATCTRALCAAPLEICCCGTAAKVYDQPL